MAVASRGTDEWNPFLGLQEMMAGKISSEDWASKCEELGIARLAPAAEERDGSAPSAEVVERATLFDAWSRRQPMIPFGKN
ncbi:MAG TPA: hypothetical protein VIW68_10855 [Candidatus Sulfotelmatobacter sp.]